MGFLKFLKRSKGKEPDLGMENLDMPPTPPGFEEKDLVGKEIAELPELPEIPKLEEPLSEVKSVPEFKFPSIQKFPEPKEELKVPELPPSKSIFSMEKLIDREPRVDIPKPGPIEEVTRPPETTPYESFERSAVREERAVLGHKEAEGPIFIRVDRFRDILTNTNILKNELKTASHSIVKLNEIDVDRDKVLGKWRNSMIDLQKKLIFIDKTLFKR